jgi:hypothetical protein
MGGIGEGKKWIIIIWIWVWTRVDLSIPSPVARSPVAHRKVHGKVIRIAHGFACGRAHGPSAGSGSAQSLANGHDRFFPVGALVVPAVVVVHIYIFCQSGRSAWTYDVACVSSAGRHPGCKEIYCKKRNGFPCSAAVRADALVNSISTVRSSIIHPMIKPRGYYRPLSQARVLVGTHDELMTPVPVSMV